MKLGFAGTPEFARVALERLIAAGFETRWVLTQPDRPAGRGLKLQASAVKQLAQSHGVPVLQPHGLRLDGKYAEEASAVQRALLDDPVDAIVVAAYGLILPRWLLELPRLGCLNIHASLLPRWRGAAPIQRAIEAGDPQTGITIMQMDEGLDTGDMLLHEALPIGAQDTTASLHDRLASLGGRLIVQALELAAGSGLRPERQPTEGISYASKIDKLEARIDWTASASSIERRVRAFDPFPGSHFELAGQTVKLWQALPVAMNGDPGEVLIAAGGQCVVACGEQALSLQVIQRPGARRAPVEDLLRHATLQPGQRLS